MSALVGFMLSTAVVLLYNGIQRIRTPRFNAHLTTLGTQSIREPQTFYERRMRPILRFLADRVHLLRGFTDQTKIAQQLDYAGNPSDITPREFYGVQLVSLLGGFGFSLLWVQRIPVAILILPIVGFYYPLLLLKKQAKQRQWEITLAVPDFLDLLATSVSAGVSPETALTMIVERGEGPLYEELQRMLQQIAVGEQRERALRHLCARNTSKALHRFVHAMMEEDKMGTPIAHVLDRLSEDMRVERRIRAKESVDRLEQKLTIMMSAASIPVTVLLLGATLLSLSNMWGDMQSFTQR